MFKYVAQLLGPRNLRLSPYSTKYGFFFTALFTVLELRRLKPKAFSCLRRGKNKDNLGKHLDMELLLFKYFKQPLNFVQLELA